MLFLYSTGSTTLQSRANTCPPEAPAIPIVLYARQRPHQRRPHSLLIARFAACISPPAPFLPAPPNIVSVPIFVTVYGATVHGPYTTEATPRKSSPSALCAL